MTTEQLFGGGLLANIVTYGTICLAAGLAGSFAVRRWAARAHQVLLLSMLAAVFVPLGATAVRHYELGLLKMTPPATGPAEYDTVLAGLAAYRPVDFEAAGDDVLTREYGRPADTARPAKPAASWGLIAVWLWAVATGVLLLRLVVTFILGRRLVRTATEVTSEPIRRAAAQAREQLRVAKQVRVLTTERIKSPLVWCWARQAVLLVPSSARCGKDIDWAGTFCHELAHLKRLDHISGLFGELLVCALPWHPLAWWARHRLGDLSEQACDDWVVAAGRCRRDYARSLLELIPQGRADFLPTVVSARRQLPGRIRRILQNHCPSPRPGLRWAIAAMLVTAGLGVTLAFAQRRPATDADGDRSGRPEAQMRTDEGDREHGERQSDDRDRAQRQRDRRDDAGRDRELSPEARELRAHAQELRRRAAEIEQRLRSLSPERDEEARDLEAELAEVRGDLARVAEELRQTTGERFAPERGRQFREAEPHVREMLQRRRELQRRAEELANGLRELPEDHPERPQLARRLEEVRHQLEQIEAGLRRAGGPRPAGEVEPRIAELLEHRRELQGLAERIEAELRELGEDHPERRELEAKLREIHAELEGVERRLSELRGGAVGPAPEQRPRREMLEMLEHRRELQARAARLERELAGAGDSPEAERMRAELREVRRNIERIDAELRPPLGERPGPGAAELERELVELREHARDLKEQLARVGDSDPGRAEALEAELRGVRMEIERLERRAVRPELPGPPEWEPRPGELERQVDELRGQVRQMQEQMAEIRHLLERLLERDRPRRGAAPRQPDAEERRR